MKNIRHEGMEQPASRTPILDSILSKLPAIKPKLELSQVLKEVELASKRLFKKMDQGDLRQADIEYELSRLPDVRGTEEGESKIKLVELIRLNLPSDFDFDIKKLPVDKE